MIDIEKITQLALDGDLYAVQELITRLEVVTKEKDLLEDWLNGVREDANQICDLLHVPILSDAALSIHELQVRLEAAEQDAARYCWLRANDPNKVMSVNTNERINKFFPNQLDESIDYHSSIKEMK